MIIFVLGACALYTIFVAQNLKAIGDFYMERNIPLRAYMFMILMPLVFINFVRYP